MNKKAVGLIIIIIFVIVMFTGCTKVTEDPNYFEVNGFMCIKSTETYAKIIGLKGEASAPS